MHCKLALHGTVLHCTFRDLKRLANDERKLDTNSRLCMTELSKLMLQTSLLWYTLTMPTPGPKINNLGVSSKRKSGFLLLKKCNGTNYIGTKPNVIKAQRNDDTGHFAHIKPWIPTLPRCIGILEQEVPPKAAACKTCQKSSTRASLFDPVALPVVSASRMRNWMNIHWRICRWTTCNLCASPTLAANSCTKKTQMETPFWIDSAVRPRMSLSLSGSNKRTGKDSRFPHARDVQTLALCCLHVHVSRCQEKL